METKKPLYLNIDQCVDYIVKEHGPHITIGMPLGLGKPVTLINALYQRVKNDPDLSLTIFTGLSLEKPSWSNDLERRFLEPFVNRVWEGVPNLDYMTDLRNGGLPRNVILHELFCKAGAYVNEPVMQQNYMASNYTHVVRDCNESYDNEVFAHIIAKSKIHRERCYSASCNADISIETLNEHRRGQLEMGQKRLSIGVVNSELPFMYGEAEIAPDMYDIIIDTGEGDHSLFNTPRMPVADPDYMIGLNVSTLLKDSGTLQIGIGALGDAIAYGLDMRHNKNESYSRLINESGIVETYSSLINKIGGTGTFVDGLYGSTEMLVDGFMQLYKSGVIKRRVYHHDGIQRLLNEGKIEEKFSPDILKLLIKEEAIHPYLLAKDFKALQAVGVFREDLVYEDGHILNGTRKFSANLVDAENLEDVSRHCLGRKLKNGVLLTGSFFIGPRDFYDTLRSMPEEERQQFEMAGVEVANQLFGNEYLRSLQRKNGRFCNTGMKATLLGGISSDGLEDGTVVSGVGGQYNFVSMAHALRDGRLIMMIKSTRLEKGEILSNIVYSYGNITIPRHLRDIVVTEYGIADLRGKCDQDCIKAMLNIADSRFQEELLAEAKKNNKIPQDYEIPEQFRNNTPEQISAMLQPYKLQGLFPPFPFGSEFDLVEMILAHSLKALKQKSVSDSAGEIGEIMEKMPDSPPDNAQPMLERMGLEKAESEEEKFMQKTVLAAMHLSGILEIN